MYEYFFKSAIVGVVSLLSIISVVNDANGSDIKDKIDSLKLLLETRTGVDRFDVAYQLIRYNSELSRFDEALKYSLEANRIALTLGDSLRIVKSGRAKAHIEMSMDNLDLAIKDFNYYLEIARRNGFVDQMKFLLNNLAVAYTYQANYDKALDCHFEGLQIREKEGDKNEISITYNNIGLVYFKLKDWARAIQYFKESERLKREVNSTYDLDRCLNNIGLCNIKLSFYKEAIDNFNDALAVCGENCDDQVLTECYYGLGVAFYETGRTEEALSQFHKSYDMAIEINNSIFQVENLLLLFKLYLDQNHLDSAINCLTESERLLSKTNYNQLKIDMYNNFSEYYNLTENYEEAARYQGKYIRLKDSVYSDELIRNLATVQTNYEERENLATIALKDEALLRQKRFNIAIITIAILAATLVFVLYRSNQVKQRVNKALSNAKATIEDQNKQLTTLNRNLEKMVDARTMELQIVNESLKRVNDELDNFIYKTSHDIRGPLASLKGICNVAMMDVSDPLALDYFMKLDATAEKLNTILTRLLIINQINNSAAGNEMIDFSEIVEDVIMLERKRGLPPNLNITKDIQDGIIFYSDKELVRIILENLIDNAIKFYNDSDRISPFVHIKVVNDDDFLTISVIDNGIGISQVNPDKIFQMFSRASERSGTGGIGLYLTKTATEKIGGQIDLKTTPEGYTEFFVRFSLNATNKIRAKVTV